MTQDSNKSTQQGAEPGKGLKSFLFSRFFLMNLALAGVVGFLILVSTVKLLDVYTGKNRYITAPDCRGADLSQAEALLKKKKLQFAISDSTYIATERPMVVLEQNPPAGQAVKRNRIVYLTVNKSKAPITTVPGLVGYDLSYAITELQNQSLKVGEIQYVPGQYENVVKELREGGTENVLEKGTEIAKNSVIDLVVTDGYGNSSISLPNLVGMTYEEAIYLIRAYNFMEGAVGIGPEVTDTGSAYVVRQTPVYEPEKFVREGSMIDIFLEKEAPSKELLNESTIDSLNQSE